jgi:hypothetical protein
MNNTTTNSQKVPGGYCTLHGASVWLNRDRGTIRRIVVDSGLIPTRVGKYDYYRLADIVEDMMEGDRLDLQQERAKLARKQTERLELVIEEESGKLCRVEDVEEEWGKCIYNCRARLLRLPSAMASPVFSAGSIAEVAEILRKQVYEALTELGNSGGDPC